MYQTQEAKGMSKVGGGQMWGVEYNYGSLKELIDKTQIKYTYTQDKRAKQP